jgi:hypothetical protein
MEIKLSICFKEFALRGAMTISRTTLVSMAKLRHSEHLFIVLVNFIMLSVAMLSVFVLSIKMLSVTLLCGFVLRY